MPTKIPVKAIFTAGDSSALGEFENGDFISIQNGGTGADNAPQALANLDGVANAAGATDHAIARFNGISGNFIENSLVTIDDNGLITSLNATYESLVLADDDIPNRKFVTDGLIPFNSHLIDTGNPHAVTATQTGAIPTSEKGAPGGVAELDAGGTVPLAQLPAAALNDGDVVGPASSTDEAIAVFDGITGKLIKETGVTIDSASDVMTGVARQLQGAGSDATPSYSFNGDSGTGMRQVSAGNIGFSTGSVRRFLIESDGTLSVTWPTYETLVIDDNDIPNKKYVDDANNPNDVISVYDCCSSQAFAGEVTKSWDTSHYQIGGMFTFNDANDDITINELGVYLIAFQVSTDNTNNGRSKSYAYLQMDEGLGGGYNEVFGTTQWMYNRNSAQGAGTGCTILPIKVNTVGTKFRVRLNQDSGSGNLFCPQDSSRFTIMRLI